MTETGSLIYLELANLETARRKLAAPSPAGIRIQSADPVADAPAIAELYNAAFASLSPEKATVQEVMHYARHAGQGAFAVLVAFDRELAVGLVVCRLETPAPGDETRRGAVELLGVRPAYRRRGIGRSLLQRGLDWLAGQSVPTVSAVAEDETVIRMLLQHGFCRA